MRGGTGRRELRSVADEVSYSTRRDTYLRLTGSAGYGAQCMEAEMTRQHVHDHSSERKGVQERWTAERVGGGITLGGGPDTVILAAAMCTGPKGTVQKGGDGAQRYLVRGVWIQWRGTV